MQRVSRPTTRAEREDKSLPRFNQDKAYRLVVKDKDWEKLTAAPRAMKFVLAILIDAGIDISLPGVRIKEILKKFEVDDDAISRGIADGILKEYGAKE